MLFDIMSGAIDQALASIRKEIINVEDPEDKIAWIIRSHIEFYCTNKCQTKVLVYEKGALEPKYAKIIREKESEYIELMKQLLGAIIQKNLSTSVSVNVATFTLLGMLNWVVHWFNPEGEVSPDQLADNITTIFLKGLKRREEI